VIILLFQ